MRLFERWLLGSGRWHQDNLNQLGLTDQQLETLVKAESTLHHWAEGECGFSSDNQSWCIVRDEETGKPYREVHYYGRFPGSQTTTHKFPLPDRETGALDRVQGILEALEGHPVQFEHQTDPRGPALALHYKDALGVRREAWMCGRD